MKNKKMASGPSPERLAVLKKIELLEKEGRFDVDAEEDPEGRELKPDEIKYLNKSLMAELKNKLAFGAARIYFKKALKRGELILNKTVGIENLSAVESGAIITCNHFNPFDSFVMQYVFDESKHKGRMYRIIREGNYTSFKGFYGFLMRNCNTLPLSSNPATMRNLLRAIGKALDGGNCILIYAEQSMWWNYRKPKPLKPGAFDMAIKNNVPVVPCFITLEDSNYLDSSGLPVQIYTPHIGKAIYPDLSLGKKEAREKMIAENERFCRDTYEHFYGIPLLYLSDNPKA